MTPPRALPRYLLLLGAFTAHALLGGGPLPLKSCFAQVIHFNDRSVPSIAYQAAFDDFYEGEYWDALEIFQSEWRGAIKTVQSRWIDSICYHTMIGECYYQMGQLDDALDQYTSALQLYLAFSDWMLRVEFQPSIRPASPRSSQRIPWGVSGRGAQLGQYPETMLINQGRDSWRVIEQGGGVISPPILFPINVQEIVRCTTLAIRRRAELLGPIGKYDPVTSEMIAVLQRRPAPPNHWSQAWIDLQLGLALVAGGKVNEALPILRRSVVAAGQYDHPMTATALFELGRLALLRGAYAEALTSLQEATYSAAQYGDAGVLEEAFRHAALAHQLANQPGVYPPLSTAALWAKTKRLRQLQVSIQLSMAEQLAVGGNVQDAADMLRGAELEIRRRTMRDGAIGARWNYLRALVEFQQRRPEAGDEALAIAMNYMRHGSPWLQQIRQIDRLYVNGQITTRGPITQRSAMELFGRLLRDPTGTDWAVHPMQSLAVLLVPHLETYEYWFLVALGRGEHEVAMEIADRLKRHRFYSTLAYGGRLQSLRWILEAPEEALDQAALLNRQNLRAEYPGYAQLSREAGQLREALAELPLVTDDKDLFRRQSQGLANWQAISHEQEAILREMAVRRGSAELVFPPMRSTKEIQAGLTGGEALLTFASVGGDLYAFLINAEQYAHWRVKATPTLRRKIGDLLREMGHFEQNRKLPMKELADTAWKETARDVLDAILDGSQADFTSSFPELVIVPDGVLWYVPFEALQVNVAGKLTPLISRFRIRYAPTASLAIPDRRGRNPSGQTAVVVGKLYPTDDAEVAEAAFADLSRAVPRSVALTKSPLPGPMNVYGPLIDQLVVLDDIQISQGPYSWLPVQIDRGKPGNSLDQWLALPWGSPAVLVLPGFHTAAERALKGVDPNAPGAEVFLSICGLMSSGTRTLVLSRWRSGGQSSFDFVREFVQELPYTTPADAWQRAILLTSDTRLDLDAEPRIQRTAKANAPKGEHPLFWAGYLLIDSGTHPEAADP